MITRRRFTGSALLGAFAAAAGTIAAAGARAEAVLGDDGIYTQPWFLQSFLVLADDLAEASAAGKRFAVVWEQKGCPYCRDMHLVNFADPAVESAVRDHFAVLSLNLHGARPVTDFDGEVLEERRLARKHGIVYTPTFQFFAETPPDGAVPLESVEAHRSRGYLKPPEFKALFDYVRQHGYRGGDFPGWLRARTAG